MTGKIVCAADMRVFFMFFHIGKARQWLTVKLPVDCGISYSLRELVGI
jgi:hypothetical protein